MAKNQGDLSKGSSKSIRNSQRRSSYSTRSDVSTASRSWKSAITSKMKPAKKENRSTEASKIIYEPEKVVVLKEQDPWSRRTINITQGIAVVCVLAAWIYHLIWRSQPLVGMLMVKALMLELVACFFMIHVSKNHYTGSCCTFLAYQYFLLFSAFSSFLQSDWPSSGSVFDRIFGLINVSAAVSVLHLIIVMESMPMIGQSVKRNDYSNRVIVESKEKRRSDLYHMISSLMADITSGPDELKVDLYVADETGHPISLSGRELDATTNFASQLQIGPDDIEFTTVKTAGASILAPRKTAKNEGKTAKRAEESIVNNSIYNKCKKQEKMLSPRKVL